MASRSASAAKGSRAAAEGSARKSVSAPRAVAASSNRASGGRTATGAFPGAQTGSAATVSNVRPIYRALRKAHPDAHCELDHSSAFELIVATVLSAQTTDVAVNKATPRLFFRYPTPNELAAAEPQDVEPYINTIGMFRQKSKNVVGLARALLSKHGGEVPSTMEELVALPGVGRKTANVVLGVAFHRPEGVVVDTHVQRISQRLGWSSESTPEKIERDLMRLLPRKEWDHVSHTLIFHGRRICTARSPSCSTCPVNQLCPSAFNAEQVGRKPSRSPKLPG